MLLQTSIDAGATVITVFYLFILINRLINLNIAFRNQVTAINKTPRSSSKIKMKTSEILKNEFRIEKIQRSTRKFIHLLIGIATAVTIFFLLFS